MGVAHRDRVLHTTVSMSVREGVNVRQLEGKRAPDWQIGLFRG
jgi:hypothetical protein